ncbi:MAG TPA: ribbon-helix-helix domain-containing protein [Trueperaceae bacterium]|nr:ribbon-helix-helix domain-containing protein [Trueperaceae bacterium]
MPKAITIRTDEETFEQLESLSRASERSRNYLANVALKEFLARQNGAGHATAGKVLVAERLEDFRSQFWREDDNDEFLAYLADGRRRSLERDRVSELE